MLLKIVILSTVASAAFADAIYSVTVISGPTGLTNIQMSGINTSGQVAGIGYNGTTYQAFIGAPSGSTIIPAPPGVNTANGYFAYAINNSGQAVGLVSYGLTTGQAFIGTAAGSTLIPMPAGWSLTDAQAVNDSGQVAGFAFTGTTPPQQYQAFIGSTSGSTAIPLPAGWTSSSGAAVKDLGQVAGYVFNGSVNQAFIGTTSGSTVIPLVPGWAYEFGVALNDSGQVAGFGLNGGFGPGSAIQAFIGTTSGSTAIPLPLGATTATVTSGSLNNLGFVVGGSDAGGWIWDTTDGTMLLNGNLAASGWNVTDAVSISNNGLILAEASCDAGPLQYVELSPSSGSRQGPCTSINLAPEPGTFVLAGTGLLLAALAGRRALAIRSKKTAA